MGKGIPQLYEFRGQQLTLAAIGRIVNIHDQTLRSRLDKGMTLEQAVSRRPMSPAAAARRGAKGNKGWRASK